MSRRKSQDRSPLILGCMGLGGAWEAETFGEAEIRKADAAVRAALDAGIDSFDHADIYSLGKAEAVFGKLLEREPSLRSRVFLQTKCGIRPAGLAGRDDWNPPTGRERSGYDPARYDFSRSWILASVDASLKRLRTDHIDRLLLHRPDPLMEIDEVVEAFTRLREEGKVLGFGLSNFSSAAAARLAESLDEVGIAVECDQVEFSLLHHDLVEAGIMAGQRPWAPRPWRGEFDSEGDAAAPVAAGSLDLASFCLEAGIEIQAWGCLAQGWLSGRQLPAEAPPSLVATAALVGRIASERGVPAEAIVLGWLLRLPWDLRPVIGTSDPARIAACAKALDLELSREEWYALYESARGAAMP